MLLGGKDKVLDFSLQTLESSLVPINEYIRQMFDDSESAGPFFEDFLELAEHMTGLGFVICQTYLTATYGFLKVSKDEALMSGPKDANGRTIVSIINHAGNYWKHKDEWELEGENVRKEKIIDAFRDLGAEDLENYPLGTVLSRFDGSQEKYFGSILPYLVDWRDDLIIISKRMERRE